MLSVPPSVSALGHSFVITIIPDPAVHSASGRQTTIPTLTRVAFLKFGFRRRG